MSITSIKKYDFLKKNNYAAVAILVMRYILRWN